jgi:hypothetical protein
MEERPPQSRTRAPRRCAPFSRSVESVNSRKGACTTTLPHAYALTRRIRAAIPSDSRLRIAGSRSANVRFGGGLRMTGIGATAPLPRSASTGEPVSDLLDVPLIVGSGGAIMREPASGAAAVEGGMGEGPCLVGTEATRNASRQSTISAIARASKARADSSNPARTGPYSEARDVKVASCAAAASRPQSRIETRATSSGKVDISDQGTCPC